MGMIRAIISKRPALFAFGILGLTWLTAVTVWFQSTTDAFSVSDIGPYDFFPLLGLMAFSALWSSYVVSAGAKYFDVEKKKVSLFHKINAYAIIALILLHPGILVAQLYADGFGLPPASYAQYVSSNYLWVVYLGAVSLLIFLAFELRHWFAKKSWWKWVLYANDVAMFLILYHGMALGAELQSDWFRYVWWFYGVVLVTTIAYLRFFAKRKPR